MKLVVLLSILLVSFSVNALTKSTRSDIRVSIEDTTDLDAVDYDANDIVFCSNWQYESVTDNNSIHRVTLSITPIAAGANYSNSVYIRNPCSGSAEIELKRPEDSCGADSIIETVDQGGMLLWTSSFTDNAFSSECSRDIMINIGGNEVCAPNKSWVVIECQDGSSIDLTNEPNNEFPFAKLFHVDAKSNGTEEGKDADDVNSDTIFGGLATIIIGHCDDPVPEEKINLIDALNVRGNLNVNDCANNAETCRNAIKSILTTHRTTGWSNVENLRKRRIPTGHGISFSAKTFINDNLYTEKVGGNGRRENPIFDEDANECTSDNNQSSYVYVPPATSQNVSHISDNEDIVSPPIAFTYLYYNRSVNGSGAIGVGDYASSFQNRKMDFAGLTRLNIYRPNTNMGHVYGYCVYNGETCPTGTINHSSTNNISLSTTYVPIGADTTVGTSAFCVSQTRAYDNRSVGGLSHGNELYELCSNPTNNDLTEAQKSNFKMMTWDQYNALIRNWEQVDENWSGGTAGSGYAYVDRLNSFGLTYTTTNTSPCTVDDGFLAMETKNGDFVRIPTPTLTGCRAFYQAPMIFDFDDSDDAFTLFTETETRECAHSPINDSQLYLRYVENMNTTPPSRESQLQWYTTNASGTTTNDFFSIDDGLYEGDYLATDVIQSGNQVTPGSTCPLLNTVHNYGMY